jgi:citrate synthase
LTNNQYKEPSGAPVGDYLSAPEAARLLGVKPATLYAYVSRGLLESVPGARGPARRYRRGDLERLLGRRGRRDATTALRFGEPVLDTSITSMHPEGPRYRGRPALELAGSGASFEAVAELLWTGTLPEARPTWPREEPSLEPLRKLLPRDASTSAIHALVVAALGPRDPGRYDQRPESVLPRARGLIRTLAASLALAQREPARLRAALAAPSVAEALALALRGRRGARQLAAIDRLLVLLADHELNASTFAARVAASAGADPLASVLAGLATLSGPRHGAASDRVEALVAEVEATGDAAAVVYQREQRGEPIPGFGHHIYVRGDPRARFLLETTRALAGRSRTTRSTFQLIDVMAAAGKPAPNIDVAAVALRASLGMPRGSAAGLFAVGRSAGWVAHVLEQYAADFLVRPRARYRGSADATGEAAGA